MIDPNLIQIVKNALPILGAIFVVVFISIVLIRIIARILITAAIKNYKKIKAKIEEDTPIKAEKVLPKEDSERFVKKEETRELVQRINNPELEENKELGQTKIVDIVKPVGFWTSMILGKKLTYLLSSAKLMNENSEKGFWVSMIEAQERAKGRERGRSL